MHVSDYFSSNNSTLANNRLFNPNKKIKTDKTTIQGKNLPYCILKLKFKTEKFL
jgi:hypothetical protein